MRRPEPSEPEPGHANRDPLARLDRDLAAFEAGRRKARPGTGFGTGAGAAAGYRLLSQMLGGILGGTGLGWLVDRFAHTGHWGLVTGLLVGSGLSIWSTVQMASRMGSGTATKPRPEAQAPDDDDDD
jgi:ATP synthase protein I